LFSDVARYSDKYREQKPKNNAKWEPGALSILHYVVLRENILVES
jgi:hypothetical protein